MHSTISDINMLAETLLSLGTLVAGEHEFDNMDKYHAVRRVQNVNRMINVPRGLLHIDQTVLLPLAEGIREVYRPLHEKTVPGLRQLYHCVAEMLAHPAPLVAAVGTTEKVVVVGSPPVDQVWVTPTARVDGQLRRRVYYLPSVPHMVGFLEDLKHELLMIVENVTPMLIAVRTRSKKKTSKNSSLLLLLLLLLLLHCQAGRHRQNATR
jgi:hypothetical protein